MFARKDIAQAERIIEYVGQRIDKETSLQRCLDQEEKGRAEGSAMVYIFDLDETTDLDGDVPDNPAKYINHSCEENCEAVNEDDRIYIEALRPIRAGEELVFDYGYDIEFYQSHPCHCGSKGCVGYIVSRSQREELKARLQEARSSVPKTKQKPGSRKRASKR
jgi:SET domain-containing protein